MNWKAITATWVDEALITEEQRDPLLAWIEAHPDALRSPPVVGAGFADAAVTGLVTAGTWLMTGALLLALALIEVASPYLEYATLVAGVTQLILGIGGRLLAGRALAQGLWSAGVLVVVIPLLLLGEPPWQGADLVLLPAVLLPGAIGTVVAVVDEQPGLAGASALACILPLLIHLVELGGGYPEVVAAGSLLGVFGSAALAWAAPGRFEALQAQVPFWGFLAVCALLARPSFLVNVVGLTDAWAWEAGALMAVAGALVLGAAALARSRWSLVTGVAILMASEVTLLFAVGSLAVGVAVLGLEGILLLAAAVAFLVTRAGGELRD